MKSHYKEIKRREHIATIPNDELKMIIANYLQAEAKAPFMPTLKIEFKKDAALNMMVEATWHESIN